MASIITSTKAIEILYSMPSVDEFNDVDILSKKCIFNTNGFQILDFTFECFKFKLFSDVKFLFLAFLFVLLISLDIFANMILIMSIMMEKNKKRVDLCFMSNALADFIMGFIIMPFTAIYTLFGHFPLGDYVCFVWNCFDFTAGMQHFVLGFILVRAPDFN